MKKKWSFIIVSPRQSKGGAIVLHVLCRELIKLGYDAKIFYKEGCSFKKNKCLFWCEYLYFVIKDVVKNLLIPFSFLFHKTNFLDGYVYKPVKGVKRKVFPFFAKDNTIVVYPEIEYGNFLEAKYVVRWFLYYNRFENDENAYGKSDLFFCFRKIFNDVKLNPLCRELSFNNFDWDLYKQTNFKQRQGVCFIIRKGNTRNDLPKSFDGIIVDQLSEKEKVKVFNSCEYCISYDTQTFYTTIATVCGCKTIIIPEIGKTRSDYLKNDERKFGVSYGYSVEEIEYAEKTREKIFEKLGEIENLNKKNVDYFIEEIIKTFGEKK